MKNKVFIILGASLLVLATLALIFWQWSIGSSQKQAASYAETLQKLISETRDTAPMQRSDHTMAVVSLDGTDFVGILEMPQYGSVLPVCASWGSVSEYPCRFDGSIYDSTMQIGATSQQGQYDFFREISVSDCVVFTDMEGNRYTYAVTDICHAESVDHAVLERKESDLTLFVKNIYSFEYVVIFCKTTA